jgi:hypothetical protein
MTQIIGELDMRKDGDEHVKLLSPMEFQLNCGRIVMCERGFRFDGGSIPAPFRAIVCPFGSRADRGWLLHDRIYFGHRNLHEQQFTRLQADEAMLEMLLYLDVGEHIAYGAYAAVRGGGLTSWQTEEEKLEWGVRENHEYLDQ